MGFHSHHLHKLLLGAALLIGCASLSAANQTRTLFTAPFENLTTDTSYQHAVAGFSDFVGVLLSTHESVILVERMGKRAIEAERALRSNGLVASGDAWHKNVAQQLKADTLLTGALSQNENGSLLVSLKAIDITSERVVATGTQVVEDHEYHLALEELALRFADKLQIPLPERTETEFETRPFASLYFGKGLSRYYSGNLDAAIMNFTKALSYDPDYVEAHYYSGLSFLQLNEPEHAKIEWNHLLRKKPDFPLTDEQRELVGMEPKTP